MIVADTHVLIWMMQGNTRLGVQARKRFDEAAQGSGLLVSAITPWEVALLTHKGRLDLEQDVETWFASALDRPGIRLAPLEPSIAIESVRLPGIFHADPADRFIVATARHWDVPVMTADQAILDYSRTGHLRTVDASQ